MFSPKQTPSLTILDVGHGNAAVLRDDDAVMVFDTGRGTHVMRHLQAAKITRVDSIYLSHADSDHIGGAVTILLNENITVGKVMINPDPTQNSKIFRQLGVALVLARNLRKTRVQLTLNTSDTEKWRRASIEILHPPLEAAIHGVGGQPVAGPRNTSNSLSAAIRVSYDSSGAVLLGGDVEIDCLEYWKNHPPKANALVFPHHGGLPGSVTIPAACEFAREIIQLVNPDYVVFSIHRTQFNNPRTEIVATVLETSANVQLACTQLPKRFKDEVTEKKETGNWQLHFRAPDTTTEGPLVIEFHEGELKVGFVN